jgi:hypothetical protein
VGVNVRLAMQAMQHLENPTGDTLGREPAFLFRRRPLCGLLWDLV